MITKRIVAQKLESYLRHEITLAQLVDWAEDALLQADFQENDEAILSKVLGRIGLADVRSFGLSWDECDDMLHRLGFAAKVDVVAA